MKLFAVGNYDRFGVFALVVAETSNLRPKRRKKLSRFRLFS